MEKSILSLVMSGHGFSGAVCLDGKITAAVSLERLTRKKYDILLPISKVDLKTFGWNDNPSIYQNNFDLPFDLVNDYSNIDFNNVKDFQLLLDYLLNASAITLKDIDCVVYSYRHNQSVERFFKTKNPKIDFIIPEHHFSHACQAYLASPFDKAAIMIIDGQGVPLSRTNNDQLSGCLAYGKGNSIEILKELPVSASLGNLYSQFTRVCGFKTNEECKTMGLASYGGPEYYNELKKELTLGKPGSSIKTLKKLARQVFFRENNLYSLGNYDSFLKDFKTKEKKEEFTDTYKNLAYAAQKITEDVMIFLANWLYEKTHCDNLCIAGGVGLNCVANYKVLASSPFKNIFIHPNAGDNGLVVGQALYVHNLVNGNPRVYTATHDYLGKEYSSKIIQDAVGAYRGRNGIVVEEFNNHGLLCESMASLIKDGLITSWWQGQSEFGPRALGNRSIIADPRRKEMKDILNSRVKFREGFRPFTPSVLKERAGEFFTLNTESPFMLLAPYVLPGKADVIPAVTHVDNTARVQTVTRQINQRYYDLIKAFEKQTGVPVLLNTSFNVAGEPIVETPEDAIKCFLSTDIDVLGIDKFLLKKIKQK